MRSDEEHRIQVAICNYLNWQKVLFYAVPNGGMRTLGVAKKLKAEGQKAGVADLCLMVHNNTWHGLYLEVKTGKGRLSETQKEWFPKCVEAGYYYQVVRSVDEVVKILKDFKADKL